MKTHLNKHHPIWLAVILALAFGVSSCGDDDKENKDPNQINEATVSLNKEKRIEPLDTLRNSAGSVTKAEPILRPYLTADDVIADVVLDPVDIPKEDFSNNKGYALKIGTVRDIPDTTDTANVSQMLEWHDIGDGKIVAAIRFTSPDAQSVRLAVDVQQLPDGALLRFYGKDENVLEFSSNEIARLYDIDVEAGLSDEEARLVWSQVMTGEAATMEVVLPPDASPDELVLAVPQMSHIYLDIRDTQEKRINDIGDSGTCELNAACKLSGIDMERRSVAKLLFIEDSTAYLCTGTLINDLNAKPRGLVMTANHCINNQNAAKTLVTYWFFHAKTAIRWC